MAYHFKRRKRDEDNSQPGPSQTPGQPAAFQHDEAERESEFMEGSIVRITMKNFLTYSHAVVDPGHNLNVIIGANGTGKSSIVCAICLGLAGKTALLGRGEKVGLFVKRGCNRGSVEIELYRKTGNLLICRDMHVENNQSFWTMNGKQCTLKAVEEAVRGLCIQVNNLCQFLPQEKVGEFSRMSNIELLEATEKSVGPPEMYKYHCDLKNFRHRERELENSVREKTSFLEKARQRNERNKHDLDRYYEKTRHLSMIDFLEKKKAWVEYDTTRRELEDVKTERDEAKRQFAAMKQAHGPRLRKIQQIDEQLKETEAKIKTKTLEMKEATLKCKQKQDQLDYRHKEIEDTKQAMRLKQTEGEDHQKRISNTRRIIEDLKAEHAKVADQPDVTPQISTISAELRRIQEERARLEREKLDLKKERENTLAEHKMLERKLSELNNLMNLKEKKLQGRHRDTYNGFQWLRENKEMFEGNAHGPMMLTINVKDQSFAKYVETHIPFQDLRAFVFQKKDDMRRFMDEVRDNKNLRVNAIAASEESFSKKAPSRNIESLRRFGFYTYLRETFEAPDEVMSYLCQQYKVHDVPVGNDQTKAMTEQLVEEPYLKVFYTANDRYTLKRSAYTNLVSSSNTSVKPSQYLIITVDAEEKRHLEEQMKACEAKLNIGEKMKDLQKQIVTLDHRYNELLAEKKELSELKGKKRQLEQKIITKQDSLKQMEQNVVDMQKIEEETKKKIAAINSKKVAIVGDLVALMKWRAQLTMQKVHLALEVASLTTEKTNLENDCREATSMLKASEQRCAELEQRKVQLTEQCKAVLKNAKRICKIQSEESLAELLKSFEAKTLPKTLEEIDAMLIEEQTRVDGFADLTENVVQEFNRGEREIKVMEEELQDKMNELTGYRDNIAQAKELWLNPLKRLVEQINIKFSEFFRSMKCAGEVDLHSENEAEYDKYGIRIRVKFHDNTQLQELKPHHQSGGERSVTIMLYLMALQDLNRCPFRVVDEINQGMDPVNERRVFDIVVSTACQKNTSQYFFITPKLLQNLHYAQDMTVLSVFNGPYMLPDKWDTEAFIRRRKRRARH